MSSISLQFGPEWMRSKQASAPSSTARPTQPTLSPSTTQMPATSLYSSLVTNSTSEQEKNSSITPFKYSKEEMLQIWAEGGGRGPLGVEIELWDGVVTELGGDPIGFKELSDSEKKLFASSLNSELRRRQSHDVLPSPLERPKLTSLASSTQGSFGQSRFSPSVARKRREESTDLTISSFRRLSLSSPLSPAGGLMSPSGGLPSPRARWGANSPALENVILDGTWRKRDDKKEDVPNNTITELDHNVTNGQVDKFTDHHIDIMASSGESTIGSDRHMVNGEDLQAELNKSPSFGDVFEKHIGSPEVDGYGTLPLKIKDEVAVTHPPGFDPDPASITWLYRDPKGNIQGPFSASLMQKWYDEGYFAPDLLVKRFQLDSNWIMVGDLAMHTRSGKLFIRLYPEDISSSFVPKSSLLPDPQPFNHFRQPLAQSDSQMLDHSIHQSLFQQPSAANFSNMPNSYSSTSSGPVPVVPNPGVLAIPSPHELVFQLSNRGTVLQPVVGGPANFEHTLAYHDDLVGYGRDENEFPHATLMDQARTFPGAQTGYSSSGAIHNDPGAAVSLNSSLYSMSYADPPYGILPSFSTSNILSPERKPSLDGLDVSKSLSNGEDLHRNAAFFPEDSVFLHRNSDKHIALKGDPTLISSDQRVSENHEPYFSPENASPPVAISSLNVQEGVSTEMVETAGLREISSAPIKLNRTQSEFSQNSETTVPEEVSKESLIQSERLDTPRAVPEQKGRLEPSSTTIISGSISAASKPAWKNSTPSTDEAKIGLREIQEAETKNSEIRKVTERQKEWNIRTSNAATDETPVLRNTWGLSVPQTRNSRPNSKEAAQQPSSPSSISSAPVWTNPTRIKQTMREIQEEEEELKKKALAKDKDRAPSASKRAYAETAHKSILSSGGAWTTVGASGRHNSATTVPTTTTSTPTANTNITRQMPITATSVTPQSVPSVKQASNNMNRSLSNVTLPGSKAPLKPNSNTVDDPPVPPSSEFIKWLRESLRGFNVGFNTEEFMTMLLAFPLDFPPSTVEVIQDMVYMNSDTMDGRRFAAEFCSRRKGDAASRPKYADGRQPSLADVVKTQPKPLQNELPFKVVKKKGKK